MQIQYNRTKRTDKIKYIVIHDTGNKGKGANAISHFNYFNSADRKSSADFFIDDKQILQVNDYNTYYTWAVGDGKGKNGITNNNSVSIEMCINSDGDYEKALANTIIATKHLMKVLNIPLERVLRHYDVSGKNCPQTIAWWEFKNKLGVEKTELVTPNDIVYELSQHIKIDDVDGLVAKLTNDKDGALYWICKKCAEKMRG